MLPAAPRPAWSSQVAYGDHLGPPFLVRAQNAKTRKLTVTRRVNPGRPDGSRGPFGTGATCPSAARTTRTVSTAPGLGQRDAASHGCLGADVRPRRADRAAGTARPGTRACVVGAAGDGRRHQTRPGTPRRLACAAPSSQSGYLFFVRLLFRTLVTAGGHGRGLGACLATAEQWR